MGRRSEQCIRIDGWVNKEDVGEGIVPMPDAQAGVTVALSWLQVHPKSDWYHRRMLDKAAARRVGKQIDPGIGLVVPYTLVLMVSWTEKLTVWPCEGRSWGKVSRLREGGDDEVEKGLRSTSDVGGKKQCRRPTTLARYEGKQQQQVGSLSGPWVFMQAQHAKDDQRAALGCEWMLPLPLICSSPSGRLGLPEANRVANKTL